MTAKRKFEEIITTNYSADDRYDMDMEDQLDMDTEDQLLNAAGNKRMATQQSSLPSSYQLIDNEGALDFSPYDTSEHSDSTGPEVLTDEIGSEGLIRSLFPRHARRQEEAGNSTTRDSASYRGRSATWPVPEDNSSPQMTSIQHVAATAEPTRTSERLSQVLRASGSPTRVYGSKVVVDVGFTDTDSQELCKVDKSLVCRGFWDVVHKVGRICLPRRSGKTYNLTQMLLFFSKMPEEKLL
ncbi:hypothetical protein GGI07_005948, partial [Coemansia sp. Benny D115]